MIRAWAFVGALTLASHFDAPAFAADPNDARLFGWVDLPTAEAVVGPRVRFAGWALDPAGIAGVEIRIDDLRFSADIAIARSDVALAHPGYPDSDRAGFDVTLDLAPYPTSADRRTVTVVAIGKGGNELVLARRIVIEQAALMRWEGLRSKSRLPFYLLPAVSGVPSGAADLESEYGLFVSPTVRVGMRVPILYLRTTKGRGGDYAFDPNWDVERRCGDRRIADDSLSATLGHAKLRSLPVLITLNGGIWADSACDAPAWDVNDMLEQDAANCQWNEKDQVMPDDALKNLPGSHASPELGRSLTFNIYARDVRRYKKRNLQQAARHVVAFMDAHPALFVGVTLDADTYLNPFFSGQQWYDYNPGTLRQFRDWLAGTGPYASNGRPGTPDLSSYRRAEPLSLADASKLARRPFRSWSDVDPPRVIERAGERAFWRDPWMYEWEKFRRHLVQLHYDELTQWLIEAGVPGDRIWSAQGFFSPSDGALPFATAIDSPVKNYDSGGVSVEGAKPRHGHLGAIVYGGAAMNDIPMENARTLFATFSSLDPGFAIVEFNTADLARPRAMTDYAAGYRALREMWNAGARYVSPMAWNGSNGARAEKSDFTSYTAWRNTPLEEAARDFMIARAGLPLGTLLYTFGSARHADSDGWKAEAGTMAVAKGALVVAPDAQGRVSLASPAGLGLHASRLRRMVIGLPEETTVHEVSVFVAKGDAQWERTMHATGPALSRTRAGRIVSEAGKAGMDVVDRIRIDLVVESSSPAISIARIAFLGDED